MPELAITLCYSTDTDEWYAHIYRVDSGSVLHVTDRRPTEQAAKILAQQDLDKLQRQHAAQLLEAGR